MQTQTFSTKPLLRPLQVEKAKEEIGSLEAKLKSPHIEDKGAVMTQLRRVQKSFDDQVPRPPETVEEEGRMVARSKELLREWTMGMCSQEEMRKAPSGAVDKHIAWDKRSKKWIEEWKNLQLRLHPGESEAASIERHRPVGSTLNMDNAVIPGKQFFLPPIGAGLPVVFSDERMAVLRALFPDIAEMLGTLSNTQRATVKEAIDTVTAPADAGIGLTVDPVLSAAGKAGAEKKAAKNKGGRPRKAPKV